MEEWLDGSMYVDLRPPSLLAQLRELNPVTLNTEAAHSTETSEQTYYTKRHNNLKYYPLYN